MSKTDCSSAVLKYLVDQNRPYSANDVMQNLHKEFGKTAIQKTLEDLARQGKILEKEYGKQKVYCALQRGTSSKEEMARELEELDANIRKTTENLRAVEQQLRESDAQLKELESTPTTEEAEAEATALDSRLQLLRTKLADLSENCVKVSPEDRKNTIKVHEAAMREYRKRKRMCMDIVDGIAENYPKSKKILMEEIGIETDEDAGVKL